MIRLIVFTSVLSLIFMAGAKTAPLNSGKGIQFTDTSLAHALQMAKAEKKLIFIDIYATWCGPCMLLKLKTFPNKDAGQFFNANFVNLSLDGEKGQGLQLFQAYRLKAFPTLIILDSDGKPLLAAEGYMDAKTLIAFGKAGMEKLKE
jgi:thioredoxin 1